MDLSAMPGTSRRPARARSPLDELAATVAYLRSPRGCPWDRTQTHLSLIKYLREESKELEKALRRGRWHEIEDELGDLLLNILLHAQIASEMGLFDIGDVAKSQGLKLRRRHPHVFGDRKFKTAREVKRHWRWIKDEERRLRSQDIAARATRGAGVPPRSGRSSRPLP